MKHENMAKLTVKLYFRVAFLALILSLIAGDCIYLDLGMESQSIPDGNITASSTLDSNTPARNGRLNYTAGSSWCASTSDSNPYLQIDLLTLHIICAVSTQGNSQADEWVETYTLQTSTDGTTWTDYKELGIIKTFKGNNDRSTMKKNIINEGILTRLLRFVGKTRHSRFCMRTEVFGVKQKPENLALNKLTFQSSDYNISGVSPNAVDGNQGSCTLTSEDNPSWWKLDLGNNDVPVYEVLITNRLSPPSLQFRNEDYKITLGELEDVTRNPECEGRYSFLNFTASAVCYNNPLRTGRYVGIVTTKQQILSLCEVEIYTRVNLAYLKPAAAINGDYSQAVDGDSNSVYHDGSCTHTSSPTVNPWWRVDLAREEPVTEVYIVNRGDCCEERLNPFEIRVGSSPSNGGVTNPKCGDGFTVGKGEGESFYCRPSLLGRYVTIRRTSNARDQFTLCEVEVYSARRGCQIQGLGLASSFTFSDNSFSSSSSSTGTEASEGRLNGNSAWSPITDDNADDYLQINLQHEFFICAVATQGSPTADHWTKTYKLLLSLNGTGWITYKENSADKVFHGNDGRHDIVKHNLKKVTRARFIRFQPITSHSRKALRVEVYGLLKPAGPSQAPGSFRVGVLTSTSVNTSWQLPPADSLHGVLLGFKLLYRIKNSPGPLTSVTIASNSTLTRDVTGLDKYTEYEFQVLAFSSVGNGPLSTVSVARTKEDVPSQAPANFIVIPSSSTSITATWQPPPADSRNGNIKGFKLFYKQKGSAGSTNTEQIINGTTFSKTVTGLLRYTEYEFKVLAFTSVGDGPNSSVKIERTNEDVPSQAPANFNVISASSTSITATWQPPPADSRNGIITGFKLFYKQNGTAGPSNTEHINNGATFSKTVTGLLEYTEYELKVLAFTSVGDGPNSSVKIERTNEDEDGGNNKAAERSSVSAAAIAVPVVLIILLVPAVGGGLLFYWRRKKREDASSHLDDMRNDPRDTAASTDNLFYSNVAEMKTIVNSDKEIYQNVLKDTSEGQINPIANSIYQNSNVNTTGAAINPIYQNIGGKRQSKGPEKADYSESEESKPKAVHVSTFAEYVKSKSKNGAVLLREEFKTLSGGMVSPWEVAKKNKEKNRYGNIVTYDHSRVVLEQIDDDPTTDYINASYIPTYDAESMCYIATQGPTSATVNAFWRMVWQEKCTILVMLTNLAEHGKVKCAQYWPDKTSRYGDIKVTLIKTENFADYVIRTLAVIKGSQKREIYQFHYTTWPDRGVPHHSTALLAFRWKVHARQQLSEGPMAVHCSAGVGRTGTFIAIDAMLESAKDQEIVLIKNYVDIMRKQRPYMVQKDEQYVFLHKAVMEALICGTTEISLQDLEIRMKKLDRVHKPSKQSGYAEEFKRLQQISESEDSADESTVAFKPANISKNRAPNIVPVDDSRVLLRCSEPDKDYINASLVDDYTQRNAYILTQAPLSNTIEDFWRMVSQYDVGTVVMLNNLKEGRKSYPQYWPSAGVCKHGNVTVELLTESTSNKITTRKFSVLDAEPPKKKSTVQHLHFTGWSDPNSPPDPQEILGLLSAIEQSQQQTGNRVIVFQCSDGVGRSGTVPAILATIERIKVEQIIDVFQTIKLIRVKRPGAVVSSEQYKFCYKAILAYLDSFNTYANFSSG